MPLFEVAVLEVKPVKDEDPVERIVRNPAFVLAKTPESARDRVLLGLTEKEKEGTDLDSLKVFVRPFA